ncbi:hypothetical protein N183_37995 [Sinorhizobium sp. Sb3]|nr:hypothetical protein N183_37995 [Sinorhizobium sp. Sb3]
MHGVQISVGAVELYMYNRLVSKGAKSRYGKMGLKFKLTRGPSRRVWRIRTMQLYMYNLNEVPNCLAKQNRATYISAYLRKIA